MFCPRKSLPECRCERIFGEIATGRSGGAFLGVLFEAAVRGAGVHSFGRFFAIWRLCKCNLYVLMLSAHVCYTLYTPYPCLRPRRRTFAPRGPLLAPPVSRPREAGGLRHREGLGVHEGDGRETSSRGAGHLLLKGKFRFSHSKTLGNSGFVVLQVFFLPKIIGIRQKAMCQNQAACCVV